MTTESQAETLTETPAEAPAEAQAAAFDYEAVFRSHYRRVARVIVRVIQDPSRAEELAVDVFCKLWQHPSAQGAHCAGWLYRTATRAALGYLSANCGQCHNDRSDLATVRYPLKMRAYASKDDVALAIQAMLVRTAKWDIPHSKPGTTAFIDAALARMKSRRPSSQMPPLGTVLPDQQATQLVRDWAGRE